MALYPEAQLKDYARHVWGETHAQKPGSEYREDFEAYRTACVAGFRAGAATVTFRRDEENSRVWWIDIAGERFYLHPKTARIIAFICGLAGADFLAADTEQNPRLERYWKLVGFQEIGKHLYSLEVGSARQWIGLYR